jgi:hypothetical protein
VSVTALVFFSQGISIDELPRGMTFVESLVVLGNTSVTVSIIFLGSMFIIEVVIFAGGIFIAEVITSLAICSSQCNEVTVLARTMSIMSN